ncbi:hypothetical protein [Salinactinospora qingdaonensis]|uniref:Uncharacterized protein n=1 Tax=Salinactinospora qingdaonensis TaxID=702744 RepID=A0ABP7EXB8_9ACTN
MESATAVLLRGLADDAGLLPPAQLTMPAALDRHRSDQARGHPMLTNRLLCPLSRWRELQSCLLEIDRIDVGVILDTDDGRAGMVDIADARVRLTHYEARASAVDAGQAVRFLRKTRGQPHSAQSALPVYLELDHTGDWPATVAQLSGASPLGVTLRCDGPPTASESPLPSDRDVADFVAACVAHSVPFRAVAASRCAARYTDPATREVWHGYLNLLLATAVAVAGGDTAEVAHALAIDDAAQLALRLRKLDKSVAVRVRQLFAGYGACDTHQPVYEAQRLGMAETIT